MTLATFNFSSCARRSAISAARWVGLLGATALLLLLAGCATGRSAFRAGDYTEAARVSAERLARQPNNGKAREVFLKAYPQARAQWLSRADVAEADLSDPFRWERVFASYDVLRDLANRAALTPFGESDGIEIAFHHQDIEDARSEAVNARERRGDELMETGDVFAAREAFGHYRVALQFAGPREALQGKREAARRAGTIVVGIDPVVAKGHGINPASLEATLLAELTARPPHGFVAFVPSAELEESGARQYLELEVGDLALRRNDGEVGQRLYEREIERRGRSGGDGDGEGAVAVVRAKVVTREKEIVASSVGRLRVFDADEQRWALDRRIEASSGWATQWDVISGDRRATEGESLRLGEAPDPELADLAQGLAEALAVEARNTLASFYYER